MYLWVILIGKAAAVPLSGTVTIDNTGLVAIERCCNDDFRILILAADIATDAVDCRFFDGDSSR
jgi:hypothetical protein